MRIVVIGRSGQLAQALSRLAAAPISLTTLGRPQLDLAQPRTIAEVIAAQAPDVVINAAAYTAVDRAESDSEAAFALNALGPAALAEATAALGVPLIHVSTDYVFDGSKPAAYVETDPTNPINVYGASKLAGEQAIAAANPRHVIARTSWVISPYGANFCKTMLRLAAERDELRVVADQHGAPTHADDLAGALLAIAHQLPALPAGDARLGIHHLCNGGTTTWADIAEATMVASQAFGGRLVPVRRIATADYPTPARRPLNSRLDCRRIGNSFAIALPDWRDAVTRCVAGLMRPGN